MPHDPIKVDLKPDGLLLGRPKGISAALQGRSWNELLAAVNRQATAKPVRLPGDGDRVDPGMVVVTAAVHDRTLSLLACPDCGQRILGGERVLVSSDETVAMHLSCLTALALKVSLLNPDEGEVVAEYHRRRDELLAES